MIRDPELDALLAEAHEALDDKTTGRVHRTLIVFPKVVNALDRVALYQTELRDARAALTVAVRGMREAVWDARRADKNYPVGGAHIERYMRDITALLDRIDRLTHRPEARDVLAER